MKNRYLFSFLTFKYILIHTEFTLEEIDNSVCNFHNFLFVNEFGAEFARVNI